MVYRKVKEIEGKTCSKGPRAWYALYVDNHEEGDQEIPF